MHVVGRGPELETLASALALAATGSGGLVLLAGEPGIGKTSLASWLAAAAAEQGAEVHWGRCVEFEGAPVYWPWRQVVRDWAERRPADTVAEAMGAGLDDIARIAPEVGGAPRGDEDDDARFRLFDAVARWLRRGAEDAPLVVMLEDLHWADASSLRLLEFVATGLADTRALVVGTYRDTDAPADSPLGHALGGLRRGPSVHHIALGGLAPADVAALAHQAHGETLTDDAAAAVAQHTAGNPFFVIELLHLLAAEARLADADADSVRRHVPPGVRDVILRRVRSLDANAEEVLGLAAVTGIRFDAGIVTRLAEGRADVVEKTLDGAVRLALLAEDGDAPGRYRFVHALVREALYDQIPRARRAALHRAAGEALEEAAGDDPDALASLAAHFLAAAPTGVADKAVDYAWRAADQATARLAHEEAVALYLSALALVDDDSLRVDLLIALGRCRFFADDAAGSRDALLEAAGLAARLGDARRMATALLTIGSGRFISGGYTVPVELLDECIGLLGDADPRLRAELTGRRADMTADRAEALRLHDEAVAAARRIGDPDLFVLAVGRRFLAFPYADSLETRQRHVEEMLAAGSTATDPQRAFDARAMRMRLLLEQGELDAALAAAEHLDAEVDVGGGALLLRMADSMGALVCRARGRFIDGQQVVLDLLARAGRRGRGEVVQELVRIHLLMQFREQGEAGALRAVLGEVAGTLERSPGVHPEALAMALHVELGELDQASELLHAKVGPDLERWESGWGGTDMTLLAWVAEACGVLDDNTFAPRLHELLAPARDRLIVAGMPPVVAPAWGTLPLGITAGLLGRYDEAESCFAEALARHQAMRAAAMSARTLCHWARVAAAAGDVERGKAMAIDARDRAEALGMATLAAQASALADRMGTGSGRGGAVGEVGEALFRREGDFWTVSFGSATARLKDTKGMHHLAVLLGRPGAEVHVLELVDGADGGHAGPVLDAQAKESYRRRIAELTEERDEAEAFHDPARAERAADELDALVAQLRGAVGLDGRDRMAAAAAERARISVSRSVKTAMQRIAEELPALGDHLAATVRTGTFCSYTPDPRAPLAWRS